MFPTIVVTFFKHYAAWGVEKQGGMQLANLEVLLGSTDILPTFTTMAFVRWSRISLAMGAALLIYWGFGLASDQAILRALSVGSGARYIHQRFVVLFRYLGRLCTIYFLST